ncbi:hypothetical protein JL721_5532 [Aureococcus anophagefferens]|nr:hypothetical protein JL721_5532 [Aureococcus anophagefferens]
MARHSKAANRTHKKRSSPGDQQQQQLPAASPLFFNCECVFSLFLVALLAALPFNINAGYFRQSRESFVMRAEELFSDGAFGTAAALYQRAVDAEETPDGHVFLAETLVRVARVPDAIAHYERAAALYDDARERLAAYSLGAGSRGGLYAAVGHLRRATEIAPTLAAAHLLLADGYRDLGLPEHAIESLRSVVKYRPRDAAGLSGLGAAHLELGHFKQSVNAYRKAHALAPAATDVNDAPADAKRRKKKKDAPRSASEATVLETISAILTGDKGADEVQRFSSVEEAIKADEPHLFAQVHGLLFDDQLLDVVLETLRSALVVDGDADGGGRWLDVLELGCGDGVAGQHLRTLANRLHCVDLSAGALAVAEARRDDVLERGEFVSTARALLPDSQDLVVAVDAVPYLGDLADFFGAVASVLRPGGLAIFNTDVLTEDGLEPGSPKKARDKAAESEGEAAAEPGTIDYRLAFTGRWQHRVKYVTGLARAHGFASVKPTMLLKVETRLVWNAREQKAGWVERGSKEARDAAIRTGVFAFRKEDWGRLTTGSTSYNLNQHCFFIRAIEAGAAAVSSQPNTNVASLLVAHHQKTTMPTLQQRMVDSTEPATRKKAMNALSDFLRDDLEDLAMRKLWRSIFFAMWLADMAPVQTELAVNVGKTIHRFRDVAAARRWLAAFCGTVRGEWDRLDKYRVDKYYMLIRHAGFLAEPRYPAGIKLHYADVVLDELFEASAPLAAAEAFLAPCLAGLRSTDEPLVLRVLDRVCGNAAGRCADDDGAKPVARAVQAAVYGIAQDEATPQRHRSKLYAAVKALAAATGERVAPSKKRAADPDAEEDDEEEDDEEEASAAPAKAKPSAKQLKLKARKRLKQKAAFFQKKKK